MDHFPRQLLSTGMQPSLPLSRNWSAQLLPSLYPIQVSVRNTYHRSTSTIMVFYRIWILTPLSPPVMYLIPTAANLGAFHNTLFAHQPPTPASDTVTSIIQKKHAHPSETIREPPCLDPSLLRRIPSLLWHFLLVTSSTTDIQFMRACSERCAIIQFLSQPAKRVVSLLISIAVIIALIP